MSAGHRFAGRVALVTGGASGIGYASARRLTAEGARVVIADVDAAAGERVAAENEPISFIACDVTSAADVELLIERIVADHGRLDAAHVNAGIPNPPLLLADTPDDVFDDILAVNLRGMFLVCKHAIRHMLSESGGALCCTSSIHQVASYPMAGPYAIAKAGIGALVRAISVEYGARGIRANCVLPGAVLTPLVAQHIEDSENPAAQREMIESLQTMKRCAQPDEIAAVVAFLLSDDASFMTGSSVAVDGGSLSQLPGLDILGAGVRGDRRA